VLKTTTVPALVVNETAGGTEVFFNGAVNDILIAGLVFVFIKSEALLIPSTLKIFILKFAGGGGEGGFEPEDFLVQFKKDTLAKQIIMTSLLVVMRP